MSFWIHSFWTGVMVGTLLCSGEHPGALFFACLFNYLYRILVLWSLSLGPSSSPLIGLLTRPPGPHDAHLPMKENDRGGAPAQVWAYFALLAFLGYVGFILAHSVSTTELDVDLRGGLAELGAASWLALLWLVQDVTGRRLVMDPKEALAHNLGYNGGETGVLALTVLTGAFLLMIGEGLFNMARTPWWMVGALLFYRWLQAVGEEGKRMKSVPSGKGEAP